jgi:hypothetical protein
LNEQLRLWAEGTTLADIPMDGAANREHRLEREAGQAPDRLT